MDFRPAIRFFSCSSRRRLALEFLLYAVLAAVMLHLTWLTWPDAYVDFSRELYLPWRVSCGDVLYRDLAYYFGPVSVYANAALFAILGRPSIHALFALNFAFWIATLVALRALLRRIASPLAATLSVCTFILLFSFNRFNLTGNYNFLAPYSHELTRGFLFALLSLLALDSALLPAHSPGRETANGRMEDIPELSRPVRLLLSGFFYALVLFTKPELSLAATASLALLFVLHAWQCRSLPLRPFLVFSLAVLATVALVVAPFAVAFHSLPRALHDSLLKLHLDCFNPALTSLPFFKDVLGTDHPLSNVGRIFLGGLLAVFPCCLSRFAVPRLSSRPLRILRHECGYHGTYLQFNESGTLGPAPTDVKWCPNWGAPHGWGLMQLDNPPATAVQLWDWRANIEAGLTRIAEKRQLADTHLQEQIRQQQEDNPEDTLASHVFTIGGVDFQEGTSRTPLDACTIQAYNSATHFVIYWKRKTTSELGAWMLNPTQTEYIENVLDCLEMP